MQFETQDRMWTWIRLVLFLLPLGTRFQASKTAFTITAANYDTIICLVGDCGMVTLKRSFSVFQIIYLESQKS